MGRPLSPHLTVYKFMYTMSLSILHRITGVALSVGFLVFVWWLFALASGPDAYTSVMQALDGWLFKLLLVGWAFAFVYHFCNGIRHLNWDTGRGLERAQARRSGAVVVAASLLLFLVLLYFGCRALGMSLVGGA